MPALVAMGSVWLIVGGTVLGALATPLSGWTLLGGLMIAIGGLGLYSAGCFGPRRRS